MQHFQCIMLYYFRKGKNTTETQKKVCAVDGEGTVTDRKCQKWFAEFLGPTDILAKYLCCGAGLCIGRCLAAPLASIYPLGASSGRCQHTQNIQINTVIGENEKCLLFYGKKYNGLLTNPVKSLLITLPRDTSLLVS